VGIGHAGARARRHTLAEGPKGLKCRTAIGSAFDIASTGTGAISLTETFAMTLTGMAFEGALVDTGTDKKEGEASDVEHHQGRAEPAAICMIQLALQAGLKSLVELKEATVS
jgi:hypothetical protein